MSSTTNSYDILPTDPVSPLSPSSPIDSLLPDSAPSSDISSLDENEESDAEREWKESLQQIELLLTMVVVPYVGKYFGRRCAFWGEWLETKKQKHPAFKGWMKGGVLCRDEERGWDEWARFVRGGWDFGREWG